MVWRCEFEKEVAAKFFVAIGVFLLLEIQGRRLSILRKPPEALI